jgi:ketosteroid isomerase-like protein
MSELENRLAVERAFEAWEGGRDGGPYDLLAPDARWTITGNSVAAGTYDSRAEFLSQVIRPFNARMSTPLAPRVHAIYADGDMVIAYFDASATVRDGGRYDNTYTWFLRMRDGAVVEAVAFFDSIAFDDLWRRVQPSYSAS